MTTRARTLAPCIAIASTLAVVGAGCGSDDSSSKSSDTQTAAKTTAQAPAHGGAKGAKLKLAADPGGKFAFDKKALTAKPGHTTIEFENASQVPHAVEVEGNGVNAETKTIQAGKDSVSVKLKPGKYKFYCPVDGHEAGGMKGVLTVK